MTKENEIKLINKIAEKNLGNEDFCHKYGIKITGVNEILNDYALKNETPPESKIEEANKLFIEQFTVQLLEILNKDCNENLFEDLINFI